MPSYVGMDEVAPVRWTPPQLRRKVFTMPKRYRKPYDAEFRARMVELVRAGRSPEQLAKEFEPSAPVIRKWVGQAAVDGGQKDGLTTEERDELRRLRRENKVLREKKEILKKAAAWFAQETGSVPRGPSNS